jgi:uncharacterized membrane protein
MNNWRLLLTVLEPVGLIVRLVSSWIPLMILLFTAVPMALVFGCFIIWAVVEAFGFATAITEEDRSRRSTASLRRLFVASILAVALVLSLSHNWTDPWYHGWRFCLLGWLPLAFSFAYESFRKPSND